MNMIELIGPVLGIGSIVGIVILVAVLRAWDSSEYGPADEPWLERLCDDEFWAEEERRELEAWNNIVDNPEHWG